MAFCSVKSCRSFLIWQSAIFSLLTSERKPGDVHNFFCVCFIRVSTEARDLVSAMLNINPLTRPSLKQIRRHPWMTMKGDMAWAIVRIHSLAKTMWPANEIRQTSPVLAPVVQRDDISILIHWINSKCFDISYPLDCPIQPLSNRGLIFRTSARLVKENEMLRTSHLDVPRTSLDLSYA